MTTTKRKGLTSTASLGDETLGALFNKHGIEQVHVWKKADADRVIAETLAALKKEGVR